MSRLIEVQKKLLPDLLEVMQKRYFILQSVRLLEPIGRRGLASYVDLSERVLRGEVDFLKDQSLLDVSQSGMKLTSLGHQLLFELEDVMKDVLGIKALQTKLKELLGIKEIIIVTGDSDQNKLVKTELGRACVAKMKSCMTEEENVVAVTGGTTLAEVADMMTPLQSEQKALFVPARGGLGENVKNQANTICANMAEHAQGEYRLLHVPDQISVEAYRSITQEPSIKEVLKIIQAPTMVVHGIGDALLMAKRRKTSAEHIAQLEAAKASGEAFGYYFNEDGEVVFKVNTVGLQLEDVQKVPCVIAVAGGTSKAKAISSYMKQAKDTILITDEGAAVALLHDLTKTN